MSFEEIARAALVGEGTLTVKGNSQPVFTVTTQTDMAGVATGIAGSVSVTASPPGATSGPRPSHKVKNAVITTPSLVSNCPLPLQLTVPAFSSARASWKRPPRRCSAPCS